jgi:hypothetical protein
MILRVYAMWNKSKRILYILLFIYVPQGIVSLCYLGIYHIPNISLSGMSQLNCKPKFICGPLSPITFSYSQSCPSY